MKPYLISIGGFELRYYSLMYIIAFLLGIYIASKDLIAKKRGIENKKMIEDYAFVAMLSGLIGARLYYVIFKFPEYSNDLISIFQVWKGGLAIHGGIIGAFVGTLVYAKKQKINLWVLADMGVGPLLIGQAIGRFGNYANGEIHGVPTFTPLKVIFFGKFNEWWQMYQTSSIAVQEKFRELVPWGVVFPLDTPAGQEFPNTALHPAMIYEMILNFIGFFILWFYFRKKEYKPGILSMIYLIMYALIRSFVSMFRAEDLTFFGIIRAPHLISIIMILLAVVGIKIFSRKK